jgi:hypothetical protein
MDTKLKRVRDLVGDLIWHDYDRLSTDGQGIMQELCQQLNIQIEEDI